MALRDQPYFPLYVQDYLTDEKLNICSWSTQGIYIKILCILHKQNEYGTILFKQNDKQTFSTSLDFASILIRLLPCQMDEMVKALDELIENGVLIIEGNKLYQKRMVKDGKTSIARSIAGKSGGGNPILLKQKDKQKDKQNTENENKDIYNDVVIDSINTGTIYKEGEIFDFYLLQKNTQWIEAAFSQIVTSKRKNVTYEKFISLLDNFCNEKALAGEQPKNEYDYRRHFINWANIQVDKPENQSTAKQNLPKHLINWNG